MVETKYSDDVLTAKIYGEIDHRRAQSIRTKIDAQTQMHKPKELKLDFSNVSFMDSSGIGLIMGRYKLMKSVSGRIRVENLSPSAYKVMKLAGLERLGEIKQREVV